MQIKLRRKNYKLNFFIFLAVGLSAVLYGCLFLCFGLAYAYAQERIVAVVNKDVITQKDLNDFTNILRLELSEELEGHGLEERIESMRPELLNRLIDDRLILQEAKKEKMQINESMVKARMAELKKHYPSEEDFNYELSMQGLVQADLETKIRDQHLMRAIVETKIRRRVSVTPSEIADFYESNKEKFVTPVLRQLEVSGFKDASLAQELYNEIEAGKISWRELLKKHFLSADQITAARDGQLRKEVEDAVFKLEIDEITFPIKVGDTDYVFKLENIIPSRQQPLSEAQEAIRSFISNQKIQKEIKSWLDDIKKKAYIKIF